MTLYSESSSHFHPMAPSAIGVAQVVNYTVTAAPGTATVAPGTTIPALLYDGMLPGPTLTATSRKELKEGKDFLLHDGIEAERARIVRRNVVRRDADQRVP